MKFLRQPIHPFLLSAYPIAHLYARNLVFIPLGDTLRSFAVSLGLAVLLLLGFRPAVRSWARSGVLTSLILILLFSFGHVANSLSLSDVEALQAVDVVHLRVLWLALFLGLSFLLIRSRLSEGATQALNVASAVLLAFPLATIVSTLGGIHMAGASDLEGLSRIRGQAEAEASMPERSASEMPDIYYVIFDGYVRTDLLEEIYDYDCTAFLEALAARGFYVAESSRSNYLSTNYSLNTSLNLVYFHEMPPRIMRSARYNLRTNYVSDFLRERGYQIVVFDSGSRDTNNQYADVFVSPEPQQAEGSGDVNPFEQLLLRTTLGSLLFERANSDAQTGRANDVVVASVNRELSVRRERISHALDHLPDYAGQERPNYLFAHIYLPHIPFLYGPGGQPLEYHGDLSLYWYEVAPEDYLDYYAHQVDYLNNAILGVIDSILVESRRPVVIILQGDHGDDRFLDWERPTAEGVGVRSAILNAIYFSDRSYSELYPTITPVNTFRVILNHWFGTQYSLLPDRVFFHEHPLSTPYNRTPDFTDTCDLFQICLPAHTD